MKKKGKSCTKVQEWIKPYYKNIFIWSTTIILNNIEGYDFTGFGDVYINIDTIDKTLKNTKLSGVLFSDNYKRNYVLIDPSIINIEGADFTGSKGAYIILDNIDKLPPRCNLTDTIILVKTVEDIKKFNLKKYGKNVQIRQYSIIKDESIDVNFNEYLNYFGAINISEYKDLEDALRIETDDIEVIREKMNRTIAYDIAFNLVSSFAKIFDLKKALAYLIACCKTLMILEKNSPSLEMAEYLEYLEYTYNQYQRRIGDPALDRAKIIHNKEYYKIFTKNGVFTINTEKLVNVLSNVIWNHNDDSLQFFLNELNAINNHIEEMDRDKFIKLLTSSIANIIYQNLETNNMGYSNTLKMTKNTKKK